MTRGMCHRACTSVPVSMPKPSLLGASASCAAVYAKSCIGSTPPALRIRTPVWRMVWWSPGCIGPSRRPTPRSPWHWGGSLPNAARHVVIHRGRCSAPHRRCVLPGSQCKLICSDHADIQPPWPATAGRIPGAMQCTSWKSRDQEVRQSTPCVGKQSLSFPACARGDGQVGR